VTTIGVVALLAPGLFVWNRFITVPEGAAEVEIVGQQWQWSFRLPGADGRLGKSDPQLVSAENPMGLNQDDPAGKDDVVIQGGELRLPTGKPVKALLRSVDVLHNFYVPEFRAKMDLVPGQISYVWLTPIREGTYEILCAELCGIGHPHMRGTVVVEKDANYQAWLRDHTQRSYARLQAPEQP
jgi:cytochrome c oxidase subunit 2